MRKSTLGMLRGQTLRQMAYDLAQFAKVDERAKEGLDEVQAVARENLALEEEAAKVDGDTDKTAWNIRRLEERWKADEGWMWESTGEVDVIAEQEHNYNVDVGKSLKR